MTRGVLMTRTATVLTVVAFTLLGCGTDMAQSPAERLSLQTHEAVDSYRFNTCSAAISEAERGKIHAFLRDLGLTAQDTLVVSVPKNRLPRRDADRIKTLNGIFAAYPAKVRYVQETDLRQLKQSEPEGIIRVVRANAVVASCQPGGFDVGCSTATNLAAMIAEPSDLFLPQSGHQYKKPKSGAGTSGGFASPLTGGGSP